jgi:NAD(P)-dependent dehydrogenase (short-subunit alcohol dehydrogenase family)
MTRTIAISGASGKTGYRIAEEVLAAGDRPRLLLRPGSPPWRAASRCGLSSRMRMLSIEPWAVRMRW